MLARDALIIIKQTFKKVTFQFDHRTESNLTGLSWLERAKLEEAKQFREWNSKALFAWRFSSGGENISAFLPDLILPSSFKLWGGEKGRILVFHSQNFLVSFSSAVKVKKRAKLTKEYIVGTVRACNGEPVKSSFYRIKQGARRLKEPTN